MNKTFSRMVCILLMLCLVGLSLSALAESPAFPINPPPAFGQIPTQFALFSGHPVAYDITLQTDQETGLRTYTIPNPLEWGLADSVPGVWEYSDENGWQRTGDAADGRLQLLLPEGAYELEGFPLWSAPCANGETNLVLNIYLGELRHLYAYVDYETEGNVISVTADDHSFIINSVEPVAEADGICSIYASYDPAGVLAYVTYSSMTAGGSAVHYTVDADVANQTYRLSDISVNDASGASFFWSHLDNQWMNNNYEPVQAPEGISPENLPFTLTGGWAGVPFEQPGDKPEGIFPASTVAVDPSLNANQYRPWPEDPNALYLNWAEAGPIPALPEVSWQTTEDGATLYTLTGIERWGLPENAMVSWRWDDSFHQWMDGYEPTPGQITLAYPANADLPTVFWDHYTTAQDELFLLDLNRSGLIINAGFDNLPEGFYWQMDNQGGLVYTRTMDETRSLEAIYDHYTLVEYNIHQSDENGNPLVQACYSPTDEDPSRFELGCLFLYSPDTYYEEALWIKDIGWYSYETGALCDPPVGVDPAQYPPLELK